MTIFSLFLMFYEVCNADYSGRDEGVLVALGQLKAYQTLIQILRREGTAVDDTSETEYSLIEYVMEERFQTYIIDDLIVSFSWAAGYLHEHAVSLQGETVS